MAPHAATPASRASAVSDVEWLFSPSSESARTQWPKQEPATKQLLLKIWNSCLETVDWCCARQQTACCARNTSMDEPSSAQLSLVNEACLELEKKGGIYDGTFVMEDEDLWDAATIDATSWDGRMRTVRI